MKKLVLIGTIVTILIIGGVVIAQGVARNPATVMPSGKTVIVPGQATDNSPVLERVTLIHYKKGYGQVCDNDGLCEPELGENPSCADCKKNKDNGEEEPDTSSCYAFLGADWKELPVNYVIDPDNPDGLTEEFVVDAIYLGAEEWDNHTSVDLFGDYVVDYSSSWDSDAPDGRNELLFGDYEKDGVIAVAIVWGYFRGRPSNRRIVEFDILFDTDFTWGDAALNPTVMDLQNIATHELGHGIGLGDLYNTVCAEETMYGYSEEGETKKRTLEQPDITGLQSLYGF